MVKDSADRTWIGFQRLYENIVTIKLQYNPIQHDRTKYVEIDRHFINKRNTTSGFSLHAICEDRGITCTYPDERSVK
jgi:hypothetical protein